METQTCSKCHEEKGLNLFPRRGDSYKRICKDCVSAYDRTRYASTGKARTTTRNIINPENAIAMTERITNLESRLRAKARYAAQDPHEAEDLYSRMVEAILTRNEPTDHDAVLLQRANWVISEHIQSTRTYNFRVETVEEPETIAAAKTVEDEVVQHEVSDELKSIIAQLSPKHQKIVSMLSLGYTQREIAKKMHVTEQAVSQKVKRIRTNMVALGVSPA